MTESAIDGREELGSMLESLVRLIEHHSPAMRCSVLLLDADGVTLRHGAAPSLPAHYCEAIDGLRIGPGVGSCGTAAFTRETTIVGDIATHAYWADFRSLALPIGLRACWSTPIMGAAGGCLGTFAMYYGEPREPSGRDLELIATASQLAGALIERESLLATTETDRRALVEANELLEEQQVELELVNQQLQENAAELEMQADALEAANAELRASEERLRDAVQQEEVARAAAELANHAKSEFLATMSHELRTPLNAIGGYADLLLDGIRGPLSAAQRSDIERMKRSGKHLLGLINDILNFAKLEAGRVEFHLDDLPVASLLQSLEELVRPQVDARRLAFTQHLAEGRLVARGDAEKTRQVLLNLVTNAVKFTEPGGRIAITCVEEEDRICISVQDTGRGIPRDQLSRIFDPFVQIDRDRTPEGQQGVGLGLSICRDLALGMGGSITASSVVGEGSTFTLTLPRAVSAPRADAAADAPSSPAGHTLQA